MKRRVVISVMLSLLAISVSFGQSGKKFYKAGNQFMAGMKYDDAIVQFTNAINAEPSNSNYYVARGNAYEMAGKLNEAFADFEKALVFKPKDVKTLISAGRVCNKLGKYDEALNYLNRAKSLDKMNK
ncbi:MAG TPA: hypothetical protein DFI01_01840, partial [Bacteroidales bacterium]|nr:hypothetical protein [Bacteroidales bacterium]